MGRVIGSVVLGYVVVFASVFAGFTATWIVLGMDGAFQPGNFAPSTPWVAATFIVGLLAGGLGGLTAAAMSKSDPRALWGLMGLLVVLGLLFAIPAIQMANATMEVRSPGLTMFEAMQKARTPVWLALLNPVIGAAGAWLGFRMKKSAAPVAAA
jgi:heme/copper-type cytochrome/quinol oxidase subunit 3